MKSKKLIGKTLTLVLLGILVFPPVTLAQEQRIVITEIAAYEPGNHEWIEILNLTEFPVDLTDWKFYENETNHSLNEFQGDLVIEPGEYAIIADVAANFVSDYPEFKGTVIDSSWSSLKEEGEEIKIINSHYEIVESFTYLHSPETSLQKIDPELVDYTENNWQAHADSNSAGRENEFETSATCALKGDLNQDGLIDTDDLNLIRQMIMVQVENSPCADLNNDQVLSPPDIIQLRILIAQEQKKRL